MGDLDNHSAGDVPAEWHGWLHGMTNETPVEKPPPPIIYKLKHQPTKMSQVLTNTDR